MHTGSCSRGVCVPWTSLASVPSSGRFDRLPSEQPHAESVGTRSRGAAPWRLEDMGLGLLGAAPPAGVQAWRVRSWMVEALVQSAGHLPECHLCPWIAVSHLSAPANSSGSGPEPPPFSSLSPKVFPHPQPTVNTPPFPALGFWNIPCHGVLLLCACPMHFLSGCGSDLLIWTQPCSIPFAF